MVQLFNGLPFIIHTFKLVTIIPRYGKLDVQWSLKFQCVHFEVVDLLQGQHAIELSIHLDWVFEMRAFILSGICRESFTKRANLH